MMLINDKSRLVHSVLQAFDDYLGQRGRKSLSGLIKSARNPEFSAQLDDPAADELGLVDPICVCAAEIGRHVLQGAPTQTGLAGIDSLVKSSIVFDAPAKRLIQKSIRLLLEDLQGDGRRLLSKYWSESGNEAEAVEHLSELSSSFELQNKAEYPIVEQNPLSSIRKISAAAFLLGIVLFMQGFGLYKDAGMVDQHVERARAVLIDKTRRTVSIRDELGEPRQAEAVQEIVRFSTKDGRTVKAILVYPPSIDPDFSRGLGETVDVVYMPDKPEIAVVDAGAPTKFKGVLLMLIGGAAAVISAAALRFTRRRKN